MMRNLRVFLVHLGLLGFLVLPPMADVLAGEDSAYEFDWLDPDKEVYVLQNRKYRKKGKLYASGGGGLTTSGPFTDGKNVQARAGFFFFEEWGIEVLYGKNFFSENDTALSVKSAGAVPFSRNVEDYQGGLLMWSPFYAKINTFNQIVYFDWLFGAGFANLNEENNRTHLDAGNTSGPLTYESHAGFMWDTGFKFYLGERWNIRLDLLGIYYKGRRAIVGNAASDEDYYSHYDLTLSLGFALF